MRVGGVHEVVFVPGDIYLDSSVSVHNVHFMVCAPLSLTRGSWILSASGSKNLEKGSSRGPPTLCLFFGLLSCQKL